MKIIIDKMALNQWKNKVSKMHESYRFKYVYHKGSILTNQKNLCDDFADLPLYNYRELSKPYWNCTTYMNWAPSIKNYSKIISCWACDRKTIEKQVYELSLPKKYIYSSGMNDRNGYKKN